MKTIVIILSILFLGSEMNSGDSEIRRMAQQITKNCISESEKVKALYLWITENIEYDLKTYHKIGR